MDYVRFFFGTPARLFVWLVLAGLATVAVVPGLLAGLLQRFLSEVLGPVFTLGVVYLGFRTIFGALTGSGGKRRK